ncbi:MAG: phosphoadenylyl-sulfate reductase [Gammaproteobacteria bacterium]
MTKKTTTPTFDVDALAQEYADKSPQDILALAVESFDKLAISFSGAEDVVLVDMATRIKPDIEVFSLDTGRLHPETYRFLQAVREHYRIELEVLSPDVAVLQDFVKHKGLFSFYQDGHRECCSIRKVMPLRQKLSGLSAWVSGQRRDQSPATRTNVSVLERDAAFSTADNELVKFNPLACWSSSQVWDYIRANDVPYNELHNKGFISIGCEPCTRAVLPNQHERSGRWWWEVETLKECGLHLPDPE